MNNIKWIVILLLISYMAGYCSRENPQVKETTITKRDTVFIETLVPDTIEIVRKVSVPIYVPTPADTVVDTLLVEKIDTLLIDIAIEKREYMSDVYRAVVTGPTISNLHPSLDTLEIYNSTTTITKTLPPPLFSPYVSGTIGKSLVGVGGGIFIRDKHAIGLEYWSTNKEPQVALRYMYKF